MMDLYGVKSLIEDVEKAIENKEVKTLNRQQEKYLKDRYNSFVKFEYFEDDMGNYVVSMTQTAYKSFRYYLGMEYEDDYILQQLQDENDVIIVYDYDCERLSNIIEKIEKNKII